MNIKLYFFKSKRMFFSLKSKDKRRLAGEESEFPVAGGLHAPGFHYLCLIKKKTR